MRRRCDACTRTVVTVRQTAVVTLSRVAASALQSDLIAPSERSGQCRDERGREALDAAETEQPLTHCFCVCCAASDCFSSSPLDFPMSSAAAAPAAAAAAGSASSKNAAATAPPLISLVVYTAAIEKLNKAVNPEMQLSVQVRMLIVRILNATAQHASAALVAAVHGSQSSSAAPALETVMLDWVSSFIGGSLTAHARREMEKSVQKLRSAGFKDGKINIDATAAAAHGITTPLHEAAGLLFPIVRFRSDCTFLPAAAAETNDVASVHLTALLEYLTMELLEIAGSTAAGKEGDEDDPDAEENEEPLELEEEDSENKDPAAVISSAHLRSAIRADEEFAPLMAKLGLAAEMQLAEDRLDEAELLASFPRTQTVMNDLMRFAWWNHETTVDRTLRQYLSGSLPQGSLPHSFLQSHLRPVRYFGRTRRGVLVGDDGEFTATAFLSPHGLDTSLRSIEALWMNLCACDLIDAQGREFPVLYEARVSDQSAVNTAHGAVFDRRTGALVAMMQREGRKAKLQFNSPEARQFWARYEPHPEVEGETAAAMEDDDQESEAAAADDDGTAADDVASSSAPDACALPLSPSVVSELRAQFSLIHRELFENFTESRLEMQSVWSAAQPSEIVKRFTLAWLQSGFGQLPATLAGAAGSVASSSASSDSALPFMPVDLLNLIGDYCPIDLPFLPLTVDPAAPLPASVNAAPTRSSANSPLRPSAWTGKKRYDFFFLREEDGSSAPSEQAWDGYDSD